MRASPSSSIFQGLMCSYKAPTCSFVTGVRQFLVRFYATLDLDALQFAPKSCLVSQDRLLYWAISCLYATRQKNIMNEDQCQVQRRDFLFFGEKFGSGDHVRKDFLVCCKRIFNDRYTTFHLGLHFSVSMTRAAVLDLFFAGRVDSKPLMDPCFASRRSRTLEASK